MRPIWALAALIPIGDVLYASRYFRPALGKPRLWFALGALAIAQVAFFLMTFLFLPRAAFLLNVVAGPTSILLLQRALESQGILHVDGRSSE
jgi:hypothetical protein